MCVRMFRACCSRITGFWWYHIALMFVNCILVLTFCHLVLVSLVVPDRSRPMRLQVELVVLDVRGLPGLQLELIVPGGCRLSRIQVELVVPSSCRPL